MVICIMNNIFIVITSSKMFYLVRNSKKKIWIRTAGKVIRSWILVWIKGVLPIIISPINWFTQGCICIKMSLPDINADWLTWNSHSPFLALQGDSGYGGFTDTSPIDCTHLELVEYVFLKVCHLNQWDRNI